MESIYELEKALVLRTGNRLKFFFILSKLFLSATYLKEGKINFSKKKILI